MAPLRIHLPKNVSRWGSVFSRETKFLGKEKNKQKNKDVGSTFAQEQ